MKNSTLVLCFGRMNPPTKGHEKLIAFMEYVGRKYHADCMMQLSGSEGEKKNPLPFHFKVKMCKQAFDGYRVHFSDAKVPTLIHSIKAASGRYKHLIFVVGSDRMAEMQTLINKYNGSEYKFDSIRIMSAGERDPDADGVAGISASKMREYARTGDWKSYRAGLPRGVRDNMAKESFNIIRKMLATPAPVKEDIKLNEGMLSSAQHHFDVAKNCEHEAAGYERGTPAHHDAKSDAHLSHALGHLAAAQHHAKQGDKVQEKYHREQHEIHMEHSRKHEAAWMKHMPESVEKLAEGWTTGGHVRMADKYRGYAKKCADAGDTKRAEGHTRMAKFHDEAAERSRKHVEELKKRGFKVMENDEKSIGTFAALFESTPPGMEDQAHAMKPSFKKRYGKRWQEVLYRTLWKQHNEGTNPFLILQQIVEDYGPQALQDNPDAFKGGFQQAADQTSKTGQSKVEQIQAKLADIRYRYERGELTARDMRDQIEELARATPVIRQWFTLANDVFRNVVEQAPNITLANEPVKNFKNFTSGWRKADGSYFTQWTYHFLHDTDA